jgi:hypothetical protein
MGATIRPTRSDANAIGGNATNIALSRPLWGIAHILKVTGPNPVQAPRASRRKAATGFRQKAILNQLFRATWLIPESGMLL